MELAIVTVSVAISVWVAFQVFLVKLSKHVEEEKKAESKAWDDLVHGGINDPKDPGGVLRQARQILADHSARRSITGINRN
jgi:hypothetical protein